LRKTRHSKVPTFFLVGNNIRWSKVESTMSFIDLEMCMGIEGQEHSNEEQPRNLQIYLAVQCNLI
jgi:hypothetical protein